MNNFLITLLLTLLMPYQTPEDLYLFRLYSIKSAYQHYDLTNHLIRLIECNDYIPPTIITATDKQECIQYLYFCNNSWHRLAILLHCYSLNKFNNKSVLYNLKQLRQYIGDDAYYQGKMPPPLPPKWFPNGYQLKEPTMDKN